MNTNKVCGEFPEYCYKAFECEEHAKDFIDQGTFRMGCQHSYTAMENEQLRDPTEGKGLTKELGLVTFVGFSQDRNEEPIYTQKMAYQENHIESGNARFCFCTYLPSVQREHMKNNIDKYIVKINNPRKLAEDINDYFFRDKQKVLVVGWPVVYNKGEKLGGKLGVNEKLDLAYMQKPESFSPDCEFRISAIKLSESCDDECKFLSKELERADPKCKYIEINLRKPLDYTQFYES
jgi:hypothetical protein